MFNRAVFGKDLIVTKASARPTSSKVNITTHGNCELAIAVSYQVSVDIADKHYNIASAQDVVHMLRVHLTSDEDKASFFTAVLPLLPEFTNNELAMKGILLSLTTKQINSYLQSIKNNLINILDTDKKVEFIKPYLNDEQRAVVITAIANSKLIAAQFLNNPKSKL